MTGAELDELAALWAAQAREGCADSEREMFRWGGVELPWLEERAA